MKKYIAYLISISGFIMILSMVTLLERRCITAETELHACKPIVTQFIASQSGADDSPPLPSITIEDRMNLVMSDTQSTKFNITPTTAKWILISGLILASLGFGLQERVKHKKICDEQSASSNQQPTDNFR